MKFSHILFDNDGVLVDSEFYYYESNRIILAKYKIDLTLDLFLDLNMTQGKNPLDLAIKKDPDKFSRDFMKTKFYPERNKIYIDLLKSNKTKIFPKVLETLEQLKQKNIKMAIVTSSHKKTFDIIHQETGILNYMDFVLNRDDYNLSKPHPEPYLTGLKKFNIPADQAFVVEDSPRGINAGNSAGIFTVAIPNSFTQNGDFKNANVILNNFEDILKYF